MDMRNKKPEHCSCDSTTHTHMFTKSDRLEELKEALHITKKEAFAKTNSTVAGAITPVPGGPGPMTIACLLANTLEAAKRSV